MSPSAVSHCHAILSISLSWTHLYSPFSRSNRILLFCHLLSLLFCVVCLLLLLFTCLFGFCLPSYFCASLCFWRVFFFSSASAVLIFLRLPGPCHTGNVEGVPWTKIKGQLPALPQRPQSRFLRHAHQEGTCKEPQTTELLPGDPHWNNMLPADSSALKELTTLKMYSKILP